MITKYYSDNKTTGDTCHVEKNQSQIEPFDALHLFFMIYVLTLQELNTMKKEKLTIINAK